MKHLSYWLVALVLAVGVLGVVYAGVQEADNGADEDEKEVTIDQVPAAVRATILAEAAGNAIEEIEEETEDGVTVYEAEWKADGKETEIKVAADGQLLATEVKEDDDEDDEDDDGDDDDDEDEDEDEEKVTLDQVPAEVKATILAEAAGNAIEEIERENENGQTVYEAEWKVDGKEIEIKVAEDGKLLAKEVDDEDDDDDDDEEDDD